MILRELALRSTRPLYAVGVDTSTAMLARVPELPSGWSVCEGDVLALPFAADEFEVAVASYILHVLPEGVLASALAELARVLRPGGRLVTVTPLVPSRGPLRALGAACDVVSRWAPATFGGLHSLDPRRDLERAGFALLRSRTLLRGYPSLCVLAQLPAASGTPFA